MLLHHDGYNINNFRASWIISAVIVNILSLHRRSDSKIIINSHKTSCFNGSRSLNNSTVRCSSWRVYWHTTEYSTALCPPCVHRNSPVKSTPHKIWLWNLLSGDGIVHILVQRHQHFSGTSCLHLQWLRENLKTMVPTYKALNVTSQDINFQILAS
jgi:hypothetical protein